MKISTLSLCLVAAVVGLSILVGVLYNFTVADSRRLAETQSGLESAMRLSRAATAGWNAAVAEKITLENELFKETAVRAAAIESLKNLEWQLKDATRESMRVEGKLTQRLNEATVVAEALQVQLASMQKKLGEGAESLRLERLVKEATLRDLAIREAEAKRLSADLSAVKTESAKLQKELSGVKTSLKAANSDKDRFLRELRGRWSKEGDYRNLYDRLQETEALVERIESAFIQEGVKLSTGNSNKLTPVIFLPVGVKTPAEADQRALVRATSFNQVWFQNKLGDMTFGLGEPIVFRGRQGSAWYDALSSAGRVSAVHAEITGSNVVGRDGYVVFMYGISDPISYGDWGHQVALMSPEIVKGLLSGDSLWWWQSMAIVAHEIGHLWGLPHLVSDDKAAIMRVGSHGAVEASKVYPLATFSEQEKNILRIAMRKE